MPDANAVVFALVGGIFPALLWLWFWLREDSVHPEPKRLVFYTFLGGAAAVIAVIPIQIAIKNSFGDLSVSTFFLWSLAEEFLKFAVAYLIGIRTRALDEPVDAVMYMITAALGFSAFENALFLFNPLVNGAIADSIITGSQRFVGASLLHVLSSAVMGIFLAFSFFKNGPASSMYTILGLAFAVTLHTLFNLSIIDGSSVNIFATFTILWILVIGLLFLFEKVKRLSPIRTS